MQIRENFIFVWNSSICDMLEKRAIQSPKSSRLLAIPCFPYAFFIHAISPFVSIYANGQAIKDINKQLRDPNLNDNEKQFDLESVRKMRLVSLIKSIGYAFIFPLYALVSAIKIAVQIIFNPRSAAQMNHPKQKILLEERLLADKKKARIAPNQNRDNREYLQIDLQQDASSTQNEGNIDNLDSSIISIPQKEDENNGYIMPNIHKKTDDVTDQNGELAIESKKEAQLQDIDLLEENRDDLDSGTTLPLQEDKEQREDVNNEDVRSNIHKKTDDVTDQNDELAIEAEPENRDLEEQREKKLNQLNLICTSAMKVNNCKPAPTLGALREIEKIINNINNYNTLASYNVEGAFLLQQKCQYTLAALPFVSSQYCEHEKEEKFISWNLDKTWHVLEQDQAAPYKARENQEKEKFIFWNNMLQKWYPLEKDQINAPQTTTEQLAMIHGYINNFYLPAKKILDDLKSKDNSEKTKNAADKAWEEFEMIHIKDIRYAQFKMQVCFNKHFQD